jgi:hypothetical protein
MLYMHEVNNNNNTNTLDRARIEKGNFSSVDSKNQEDDIIAMTNTETQEYTNNVSQQTSLYSRVLEYYHYHFHTYHNIIREKIFKNPKNKWSTNTQAKLFTMKYYRVGGRRKKSMFSLYYYLKKRVKSVT